MNDETVTEQAPRKRRDFLDIKGAQVEVAAPSVPDHFAEVRKMVAPPDELARGGVVGGMTPQPDTDLIPITVYLAPRHAEYVRQVGALRGHSPERALETIVREHKQRDLSLIATGPGVAVPAR